MFIVLLTYTKPLKEVDKYLDAHVEYLERQYQKGHFIASGRKVPREGGVILSKVKNKENLEKILEEDPFKQANLALYEIVECVVSMTSVGYENLKES
jgi:uncharacterized protein YciI